MASIFCGVQARRNSSRFPQKCFAPLGGKALLAWVLERCLLMKSVAKVALLVPAEDTETFAAFLHSQKLPVALFGGSGQDVLGRYEAAARHYAWQGPIMRVTGDNPLISSGLADRLAEEFTGEGIIHYLGNPLGTGVEIFSRKALAEAASRAFDPYEREHCTPHFYRNPKNFLVSEPPCPWASPNISVTIDRPEDLALAERLIGADPRWGMENFTLPTNF